MSAAQKTAKHPEPADLILYLPLYSVVVCSTCQYAIQPQAIARHLKETHHINRSYRRPFMQYVAKLSLKDAETVIESKIHEFPVPFLPVLDGFVCESEGCGHLCMSVKRMRTHWLDVHGRSGQTLLDWQSAKLQTFFRGNLLRYFTAPTLKSTECVKAGHCNPESNSEYGMNKNIPFSSILKPSFYSSLSPSEADLLNQYLTSTSHSISTSTTEILWLTQIPQIAQQQPFLLHGILALSALHLFHLSPTKSPSLIITANTYQSLAMLLFHTAITNVTISNSEAVLVFSHLLALYSFASESQDEKLFLTSSSSSLPNINVPVDSDSKHGGGEGGEDLLPPWLYFLRNGCSLLCTVWQHLESTPVAPLAKMWDIPLLIPSVPIPLLKHLFSIPASSSSFLPPWTPDELQFYEQAAHDLVSAFASAEVVGELTTWDALRVWPMQLSVPFIALINDGHPGALILLAHYCILLKRIEGYWYFEGRATRLLRSILRNLGREWWGFIQWPLEEIGIECATEEGLDWNAVDIV
ncbi:hypothetical protein NA56DRAFT_676137 [Hyaloscypha hepaticicola]|uniref:C2H2-type domain-containing protein n=1 Tax=Hyaloscypha hepaticicola TaxID=2082293 RepID=A0A2J6QLL3_9HELO|nr:hypothetical protein NA56DRAFT_676137 [Hyaloscypha hepaticicola]